MSSCKKRKAEERTFFKKWEETYLFIENMGKPLCLVCQKTVSAAKEYNLKQHYGIMAISISHYRKKKNPHYKFYIAMCKKIAKILSGKELSRKQSTVWSID